MERTGNKNNDKFHVKQVPKQQVVYGLRPVMEAIESGVQIDKILIQNGLSGNLVGELKAMIREAGLPFQYVPVEKLEKVTRNNHQGVVATVSPVEYQHFMDVVPLLFEQGKTPFILLLDHVTDVRNMGAIVRTAECAGVDAVVVPDHGSAQLNEDAIKTSSGALLRVPICREQNLKTVVNFAKHTHLVALHTVKALLTAREPTEYVSTTNHNANLHAHLGHFLNLLGIVAQTIFWS